MRTVQQGLILLLLFVATTSAVYAQDIVRGRVVDPSDETPLPGVNITVPGTSAGTATDVEGNYQLTLPAGADSLVFSYVGYETLRIAIDGRTTIDIALQAAVLQGDEVVVVGYTTERRRSISGAVSTVTPEELQIRKVATLEEALKGRIPGVQINSSGEPGEGAQVIIRGLNFVGEGTNSPLYVVDGLYMRENPNLNPDDVASIQVLKDASAAAQYGAQAANGVIVITTKRGQTTGGAPNVSYSSFVGYQEIPKKVQMMSSQEWAVINRQAYENAGMPPLGGAVNPTTTTDWQDALFQTGLIHNHNLTLSGGGSGATYLVSGSYVNQEGAIITTGFERYSLRVNSEMRRGRFRVGETMALSRSNTDNLIGFPLIDAVRMLPTIPVYDPNNPGGWGFGDAENYTFGTNPVGMQEIETNIDASNQVLGTLYAEVGLIQGLRYRFNLGFQYEDFNNETFTRAGVIRLNNPLRPASLGETSNNRQSLLFENLLTYEKTLGRHNINAVAGITEQRETFENLFLYRESFNSEDLRVINAGTQNLNNSGFDVENTLRSFLGRLNYAYADRYLFSGSYRRDGSSRFSPSNRWGDFISGSVGWVISEEPFYGSTGLNRFVNNLKLRASYGSLGNQDIGDYQFSGSIFQNRSYVLGADAIAAGATQLSLANPNIRWQDNTMSNFGLDLSMFNYRLSLLADYYVSKSEGILVRAPLPPSLGSEASPYVNAGSVRNSGFELGATWHQLSGDFQLSTSLNLTTIKNEVTDLGNGGQPIYSGSFGVTRTNIGDPIGTFFVLKTDGIFQSEAEVQAHTTTLDDGTVRVIQPTAQPGDIRFADLNQDGLINDLDRYNAGSAFPDVEGGLFLDGRYRNLDFGIGLRGSFGNEIFSVPLFWTDRLDDNGNYREGFEPWTEENQSTTTPRAIFGAAGAMNATAVSDRWIEDGSYLRIQNVVLGYTFPRSLMNRMSLPEGSLRLYVNLQNLYTFTNYTFWDPENIGMGILGRGIDDGQIFPNVRSYTIGLDLRL